MVVIPGRRPVIFVLIFGARALFLLAQLLQQLGKPFGNRLA